MMKTVLNMIALILVFGLGWGLCLRFTEPVEVKITEKEVVTNTIVKDPHKIPYEEAMADLYCFYTGFPTLAINHTGKDEYLMTASLCERRWQKQVSIETIRKQYQNMIIAGAFFDSEMRLGVRTEYYRFYGRFGFGGGLSLAQGYGSLSGGVAFRW
jgi:hypothetical protein